MEESKSPVFVRIIVIFLTVLDGSCHSNNCKLIELSDPENIGIQEQQKKEKENN